MNADDWVSVSDDLPQLACGMKNVSVTVLAVTDKGDTVRAFYCYRDGEWYNERGRRIKEDVIAWQSI